MAGPTIDPEVVALQSTGADILFDVATPKFAAQAIKKVAETAQTWKLFGKLISG